jgi:hypothetical protein
LREGRIWVDAVDFTVECEWLGRVDTVEKLDQSSFRGTNSVLPEVLLICMQLILLVRRCYRRFRK